MQISKDFVFPCFLSLRARHKKPTAICFAAPLGVLLCFLKHSLISGINLDSPRVRGNRSECLKNNRKQTNKYKRVLENPLNNQEDKTEDYSIVMKAYCFYVKCPVSLKCSGRYNWISKGNGEEFHLLALKSGILMPKLPVEEVELSAFSFQLLKGIGKDL